MRIAVLIKQVPETDALTLDPETGTVVRSEESSIVNPLDLYAIEAALRLKDREPNLRTLALSMGPPQAETALREALAMGIDEAVLISGKAFGGSDTWATSRTLSAAIARLGPFDYVFCGEKATDGDTGQVGPEVAAFLDLPVLTYVGGFRLNSAESGPRIRVERVLEEGVQVLDCAGPALLTFCKAIGEPRLPLLSGKRRAREFAIPRLGLEELGLGGENVGAKGSPTRVVKVDRPRLSRCPERIEARSEEGLEAACDRFIALLLEKGIIREARGEEGDGR